jgi:hypothetical protein
MCPEDKAAYFNLSSAALIAGADFGRTSDQAINNPSIAILIIANYSMYSTA